MSKALERATNKYPTLPPRAAMVADFIETYASLSKGGRVSAPFVLIPWQYECLEGLYPGNPGDTRVITRALISMARKQGKTEFCSSILLAHLCGPEAGIGQEIVCAAAASQEQAGLIFNGSKIMIQNNPLLARHTTFRTNRIIWKNGTINNYAKTISTRYSAAQGLIPALWFMDEIAELETRELYESLNYAQTDESQGGLGIIISTRSNRANSLFTVLHDEAVIGQQNGINKHWFIKVYSADPKASNVFTMEQVKAANPSVGYTISEKMLEADLQNAIANPSARAEFRARRLNIESGTNDSLVDPALWEDAKESDKPVPWSVIKERYKGERVSIGMDLGSTTSLTSIALYFPKYRYVLARNWMAKKQVENNETIHKAPYTAWNELGYIDFIEHEHHGGMTYAPIAEFIADCFEHFQVVAFRYDGWNSVRIFDALKDHDLLIEQYPLMGVLDKFVQGGQSYGEAIIEFRDMLLNNTLTHDGNPVSTMGVNVCQVEVVNRITGDLQRPVKNSQQLPNDPALAMLMAISQRDMVNLYDDDFDGLLDGLTGSSKNGTIQDSGLSGLL